MEKDDGDGDGDSGQGLPTAIAATQPNASSATRPGFASLWIANPQLRPSLSASHRLKPHDTLPLRTHRRRSCCLLGTFRMKRRFPALPSDVRMANGLPWIITMHITISVAKMSA